MKNEMNENQTAQGSFSLKKMMTVLKTWLLSMLRRLWRVFVGEVKEDVARHLNDHLPDQARWQAAEELMQLYRAWLGYLLSRLDESEIHVPVSEISRALDELSCVTVREGEEYIIRIQRHGGEVTSYATDDGSECDR